MDVFKVRDRLYTGRNGDDAAAPPNLMYLNITPHYTVIQASMTVHATQPKKNLLSNLNALQNKIGSISSPPPPHFMNEVVEGRSA